MNKIHLYFSIHTSLRAHNRLTFLILMKLLLFHATERFLKRSCVKVEVLVRRKIATVTGLPCSVQWKVLLWCLTCIILYNDRTWYFLLISLLCHLKNYFIVWQYQNCLVKSRNIIACVAKKNFWHEILKFVCIWQYQDVTQVSTYIYFSSDF